MTGQISAVKTAPKVLSELVGHMQIMGDKISLFQTASSDTPIKERSPSLRAAILVFTDSAWKDDIEDYCPDQITVRQHENIQSYTNDVSQNVAVTLLPATASEQKLTRAIDRTVAVSPHARIGIVSNDPGQLLRCDVPSDESVAFSAGREKIQSKVKHLYLRAYYSATLQRFYKVSLSIQNQRLRSQSNQRNTDDRYHKLLETQKLLKRFLKRFRSVLTEKDLTAIKNRQIPLQKLADQAKNDPDPTTYGLPEACPECDLDWTVWHDRKLRNGYERVGANTWRCTNCGEVLADNDPDNYHIG